MERRGRGIYRRKQASIKAGSKGELKREEMRTGGACCQREERERKRRYWFRSAGSWVVGRFWLRAESFPVAFSPFPFLFDFLFYFLFVNFAKTLQIDSNQFYKFVN
jgi:hypothetical protein